MNKFQRGKLFFYEQSFLIAIFFFMIVLGNILNIKLLNLFLIPGIISFFTYWALKNKLVNIETSKLDEKDDNYKEKIEKIEIACSENAKKIIYKYFIFIYIFYAEFSILGFPNIVLLVCLVSFFSLFLTYIKVKKSEYYIYKNTFIYGFFIILFFIPIINKIVEYVNNIKGV